MPEAENSILSGIDLDGLRNHVKGHASWRKTVLDLMTAVDLLYGYLPVQQVKELHEDVPSVEALAQLVHHELWHKTTHEQRMVQGG